MAQLASNKICLVALASSKGGKPEGELDLDLLLLPRHVAMCAQLAPMQILFVAYICDALIQKFTTLETY